MKRSVLILSLMIIGVFVMSVNANAETVSFSDTQHYWTGQEGLGSPWDDQHDILALFNFTGGHADVGGNRLNSLTFNVVSHMGDCWWALSPGDLFIDVGANGVWDYAVDLSSWDVAGLENLDPISGPNKLYSINLAVGGRPGDNDGYIRSGFDKTAPWEGCYIRDGHPVAANVSGLKSVGSANFSGWNEQPLENPSYTFDFTDLDLGQTGEFAIGWQQNGAWDVIYEKIGYTPSTPEPATMSLLGLGLAGLLGFRKKRA
jgi:PEP-CTERM putative exosortase interaction domain